MLHPQIETISKGTPVCQYPRKAYNRIATILNYLEGGAGLNIMRNGDKWTLAIDRAWLAGFIEALISPEIDSAQNEAVSEALADAGAGIATVVAGTPTVGQTTTTTPLTITLTNGNTQSVNVTAANGASGLPGQDGEDGQDGQDGVGISGISAGTATSSGGYTTTPVTVTLTSGTTQAFNVVAKNGAQGETGPQGPQGERGPAGPTVTASRSVVTDISYSGGVLQATYRTILCQGETGTPTYKTVFETVPELP